MKCSLANNYTISDGSSRFRPTADMLLDGDPGTSTSELPALDSVRERVAGLCAPQRYLYGPLRHGVHVLRPLHSPHLLARSVWLDSREPLKESITNSGLTAMIYAHTEGGGGEDDFATSRYDALDCVVGRIDLLPTLLPPFDMIYSVRDASEVDINFRLARYVVWLFSKS